MKNLSAPKLLRMALAGTHLSYCPHANDKIPGSECLCWKSEVHKWEARTKLASANRVRKPKPHKIHLTNHICSARVKGSSVSWSNDVKDVTCKQCLKFASRPVKTPKAPKISKKQKKLQHVSSSLSVSP